MTAAIPPRPTPRDIARVSSESISPRMPRDDGCTHDLVPAVAEVNLDEARDLAVHHCPVDVPEFLDEGLEGDSALARLALVKPHVAYLRIGVSTPWHGQRAHPVTAKEEGVTNDDSRCRVGNVREFEARSDVSRGKDPVSCASGRRL